MNKTTTNTAHAVTRTLLFTDLVDSTKLVEKLGDSRALEVAIRHDRVARDLLPRFDGLEIDKADGFLLLFERPFDAVGYALAYHQALAELSIELGAQLRARAGIHLGEIFLRENPPEDVARGAKPVEVEGLAKQVASRVMSLARGKQTLMTGDAFNLARQADADIRPTGGKPPISDQSSPDLAWLAHGPYLFKGVTAPVDVYEVGIPGTSLLVVPPDSAKARRAVAAGDEVTLGWRPAVGLTIPRRGNWTLKRRLGEGGFGEVWLATQTSTNESRVFKFCYEAERLRSLQREVTLFRLLRETLGSRSDIVRILDWSFDEAPYFLEVEHVVGGDLVNWAEKQGGLAQVPLTQRLEIVAQLADALAAAHSVGVLHKDVKPRNVLIAVDNAGQVRAKLADFGISEVDESALVAQGITVMGLTEIDTPHSETSAAGSRLYMAPEVMEGQHATVQADLYALGMMLYQLVAGDFRRTLGPGWRRDVDDELLADDIAAFVDREPERRTASAREVAERLRGLDERRDRLAMEQQEREDMATARLAFERVQRRRKVLTLVGATAIFVLVLVSMLALQAMRARDEAEQARELANSRREQAETLISFMLGDLQDKLERVGRLDIMKGVADQAIKYFGSVPPNELSTEELYRRSEALNQIGFHRLNEGGLEDALTAFQESLALATGLVERDSANVKWQKRLVGSHFSVGKTFWQKGDQASALTSFETQLKIARQIAGRHPDDTDLQVELANALTNIGFVHQAMEDLGLAAGAFRSALKIMEKALRVQPENTDLHYEYANKASLVGSLLWQLGEPGETMEFFATARATMDKLVELEPANTYWRERQIIIHLLIGKAFEAAGDQPEARRHFLTFLAGAENLVSIEPQQTGWQQHLAVAHRHVGLDLMVQGKLEAALEHVQSGAAILNKLVQNSPTPSWQRLLAVAHISIGQVLLGLEDLPGAERQAREALSLLEPAARKKPEDRKIHRRLAEGLLLLGHTLNDPKQIQVAWHRAAAILETFALDSKDLDFLNLWQKVLTLLERSKDGTDIESRLKVLRRQVLAARATALRRKAP